MCKHAIIFIPCLTVSRGLQYWIDDKSKSMSIPDKTSSEYHLSLRRMYLSMAFGRADETRKSLAALQELITVTTLPLVKRKFGLEVEKALLWALMGNRFLFVKLFTPQVTPFLYCDVEIII
jgi:hypothetical protein